MFLSTVAAACLVAAAIGVGIFARVAAHARWLDVPNARSSHEVPTPRGAGLVIVIVVTVAMAWSASVGLFPVNATVFAALTIAAVSAIDDVRSIPSGLRLLVHMVCAVAAVLTISSSSPFEMSPPVIVLAVIWVVGLTNAYNFMDGIDGISGAQAVVAGVAFAFAALPVGLAWPAICSVAIAAASAGFLMHNWSPARVFMGDVGSAFLGFSFAVMALQIGVWSPAAGIAAALSLWPFVFDTTLTLLRRAWRRENLLQSHRSHLYQRLVLAGWAHRRVTMLYALAATLGALAGSLCNGGAPLFLLLAVPVMAGGLWALVVRQEAMIAPSPAGGAVRR